MLRQEVGQMKRERSRGSFGKAALEEEACLYWELRQRSCDSSAILRLNEYATLLLYPVPSPNSEGNQNTHPPPCPPTL